MKENKSCLHPFIRRSQSIFSRGGSLKDVLSEIPAYQKKVASVYNVDVYLAHAVAVSRLGLGSAAFYEYLRHRGFPLPDLTVVVDRFMPVKLYSERIVLHKTESTRREDLEKKFND